MNKKELEKNILDLKYQFQMQKINASLIMLTIGILSFVGTFIWYSERLIFGISISIIVTLLSLFFYKTTKKQLIRIVKDIREL
ncbi:MAG: hypothetical protein AABY22_29705 [Nanoarchaeota archaeon]